MSASKAILVLGATGKQGGSVVRALLSHPEFNPTKYQILATTRDPNSASAQKLKSLSPSIQPVKGDLKAPAEIFANLAPGNAKLDAVFVVTTLGKTEAQDGIKTIDEAVKAGAKHIVFSSVDRGPNHPATNVPHFASKHEIEQHLKKLVNDSGSGADALTYTILRPPFFMDNVDPAGGFFGKVFGTVWKTKVKSDLKMTIVDTTDIGKFAAASIMEHFSSSNSSSSSASGSKPTTYRNAEFNIAGDKLTFEEANEIFKKKTGNEIPTTYEFFASLLLWLAYDMRMMVQFFNNPGFASSPEQANSVHPMTTFEEWVEKTTNGAKNK